MIDSLSAQRKFRDRLEVCSLAQQEAYTKAEVKEMIDTHFCIKLKSNKKKEGVFKFFVHVLETFRIRFKILMNIHCLSNRINID